MFLMLADVYLMVTNVYPMVAEESSVAYRIGHIEYHRFYRLPSVLSATIGYPLVSIVGIGGGPDAFSVTDSKVGIGDPMSSVPNPNVQIESYRHRLPSVTACPRLNSKCDH